MPTYYKYAEREADSYINWAEIGKNMSDMLANENKIREEKKAAIDEESRQLGLTLSSYPQGENRLMNEWAMTFSGNMQEARLMQDKLLKSGQLKLNDYMKMRQNSTDGTKAAFDLITDFQTDFKDMWDRMLADKSAGLEQKFAREVEAFGDFAKSDLYINPTDGKVNVAFRDEQVVDGKTVYTMNKNPNKFAEINDLRNRFKMRIDKYELPTQVDAIVNSFGEQIQAMQVVKAQLHQQGMTMEITDILQKEGLPEGLNGVVLNFKQAETDVLSSQLANPYNAASILDDYVNTAPNGKLYDYDYDEEKCRNNPELILLRREGNKVIPVLSEEQKKVALEKLRLEARMRYEHKEKLTSTGQVQLQERRAPTQTEVDINEKRRAAKNFAQNLVYSLTGDASQSAAGTKYLGAESKQNIKKTKEGYVVTNKDGETQTFKFNPDGTLADPLKFTKSFIGSVNTMGLNEEDVLMYVQQLLPKGAQINLTTEATAFDVQEKPKSEFEIYGSSIGGFVPDIPVDEEEAAETLNTSLQNIGASVRVPWTNGNYIVVKGPNGKESAEIPTKDPKAAKKAVIDFIKANPKGKTTEDQKEWIKSLQKTGIFGGGELD